MTWQNIVTTILAWSQHNGMCIKTRNTARLESVHSFKYQTHLDWNQSNYLTIKYKCTCLNIILKFTQIKTILYRLVQSLESLSLSPIQTHMQQTNFENIVTKGEITYYEQLLVLLQCFQVTWIFILSFRDLLYFWQDVSKMVWFRFAEYGKGLKLFNADINNTLTSVKSP